MSNVIVQEYTDEQINEAQIRVDTLQKEID